MYSGSVINPIVLLPFGGCFRVWRAFFLLYSGPIVYYMQSVGRDFFTTTRSSCRRRATRQLQEPTIWYARNMLPDRVFNLIMLRVRQQVCAPLVRASHVSQQTRAHKCNQKMYNMQRAITKYGTVCVRVCNSVCANRYAWDARAHIQIHKIRDSRRAHQERAYAHEHLKSHVHKNRHTWLGWIVCCVCFCMRSGALVACVISFRGHFISRSICCDYCPCFVACLAGLPGGHGAISRCCERLRCIFSLWNSAADVLEGSRFVELLFASTLMELNGISFSDYIQILYNGFGCIENFGDKKSLSKPSL